MARTEKIWMKRVLIPLWIIQLICLVIFAAGAGFALYVVDKANDDYGFDENVQNALNAGVAVQLAFSVFTIVLIIIEVILSAIHRLGPVGNIVMQCIKTAIWSFFFILTIIAAVRGTVSGWSIFVILVLWVACLAQLIYGSVILHRHRKGTLYRGTYSAPGDNAFNTAYQPQLEPGRTSYTSQHSNPFHDPHSAPTTYASRLGQPAPYPHSAETAYKPQGTVGEFYGGGASNTYEMQGNPPRY